MTPPVSPRSVAAQSRVSTDRAIPALIALSPIEIATFFPGELATRLRLLLPLADWCDPTTLSPDEWIARLKQVAPRILVSAWKTPRLPCPLPELKYVCHVVGTIRGVVPRELLADGLQATNWGDVAGPLVAEHALLLILGALRSMPRWREFLNVPWKNEDIVHLEARSLRGRRVSIHGFGRIARELVKLLKPFDVTITAYSHGVPDNFMRAHDVYPAANLVELASCAEVFVTCEALTEQTRLSIGRDVLVSLPYGSVFVNVGRGAVVDETALAQIAVQHGLRVASDVFTQEPLPLDSPLRVLPGSLYSPHMAGPTPDWYPRCGAQALDNIERYLRGEALQNQVTLELFDRST